MPDLSDVIKQIVQNNYEAQKPTEIVFGTVKSVSPVSISLEGTMLPVPSAAITLSDAVQAKTARVYDDGGTDIGYVKINTGLSVGEKVAMVKFAGGQRYLVITRV